MDSYTAYRYPTTTEIDTGRGAEDMIAIGTRETEDDAAALLPRNDRGQRVGQVQAGRDGEVFQYP